MNASLEPIARLREIPPAQDPKSQLEIMPRAREPGPKEGRKKKNAKGIRETPRASEKRQGRQRNAKGESETPRVQGKLRSSPGGLDLALGA